MSGVAERVAAGAAFLDEHEPGWWRADDKRAIDLDMLDMGTGDVCILGQRCPVETLRVYLGFPPMDEEDREFAYMAYAEQLSGSPRGDRYPLDLWAVAHGFNRPFDVCNPDAMSREYAALTAEWKRLITSRRKTS